MFKLKLPYSSLFVLLFTVIFLMVSGGVARGQYTKVRAQYTAGNTGGNKGAAGTAGTLGGSGALGDFNYLPTNFSNLSDADYITNYATISAKSGTPGTGVLPGSGGQSSVYINLDFSTSIKPTTGTLVFFKLQAAVNSSGLLGSLFSNPLSYVSIQGYNGAASVGTSTQLSSLSTNAAGEYIFTSSGDLTSIRITVLTDIGSAGLAGLLGGGASVSSLNIYDTYMFDPTCNPPTNTSVSVTGISLGGSVISPENAIDNNLNSYSTLSVGLLSALATIKQTVYFAKVSNPGDAATITFSVPAATLNLGLFNGITIQAYNGVTAVGGPIQVSSLLSLDLLSLLGNGSRYTGSYVPSASQGFDRIEISTSAVASVLQNFFLHEVQQTPTKPTFPSPATPPATQTIDVCLGSSVTISPNAPAIGNELKWYNALIDGTVLHTGNTYPVSPTSTTTYYIATRKTGCTAESERVPVTVTVNPLPPAPTVPGKAICSGTSTTLSVTSPDANYTYKWYTGSSGGTSFNTGTSYTTPTLTTATDYYVEATNNTTTCVGTRTKVTVNINALPSAGTITGNAGVCLGQTTSLTNATTGGVWTSSDETKATVDATGTVTGVAVGTATIIYTVTDSGTGCTNFTTQLVTINALPTVNPITGNSSLCVGNNITLANTTPGGIWASSNPTSATINSSGVVTGLVAGQTIITYTVTSNGCSTPATRVININPLPTASISGTTTICQGATSPTVTFTGAVGTAPYTFTYNINGGSNTTITTTGGNSVSLTIPTTTPGTFNYNLISIKDNSSTQCAQSQSGTATIIINPKPIHPLTSISSN